MLQHPLPNHPRLLAKHSDWNRLRAQINFDPASKAIWSKLVEKAERFCDELPSIRLIEGRRLLAISRQALSRISVLALVARVTENSRYSERAIAELMAVAAFEDWNPSHFLDTAEMGLAVSIGYDWLYDHLVPVQRAMIEDALLEKAIRPSLDSDAPGNRWLHSENNWVQVCHGGLVAAAVAIGNKIPELADLVVDRALRHLPRAARSYEPDGAYREGPMYWGYGTSYHVVLAATLERLCGHCHGIDSYPGFAESAEYLRRMTGPSGRFFNYADCSDERSISVPLFWFAAHYGRPDWLAFDLQKLNPDLSKQPADLDAGYWYSNILALALLWHVPTDVSTGKRPTGHWVGHGEMPVASYYWGEADWYLGLKGGRVGLGHSHMDVGSFVLEGRGIRWAIDTNYQDYHSLESAGVDLWNHKEPSSPRWSVFRIGPESHNILRFDGCSQELLCWADITQESATGCVVDLSSTYGSPILSAHRKFCPVENHLVIEDTWTATTEVSACFQWLTEADVEIIGSMFRLRQAEKCLSVEVEPKDATIVVEDLSRPQRWFDAPNRNLRRISVFSHRQSSGRLRISAHF